MKSTYLRICRLLAASGYRMSELEDFINQAVSSGPGSFLATIDELRMIESDPNSSRVRRDVPSYRLIAPISDAALKIERLLLHDAQIPRAAAIEMLSEEIRRRFPLQEIPPESRKGFANWIRRLSQEIPEKDLLFLATAIRNRVVHDAPTDWRLK
jgi:hypothetical protein